MSGFPQWRESLKQFAQETGLDPGDAMALSEGPCFTVAMPRGPAVVRLAPPTAQAVLEAEARMALLAADHGLPVVALHPLHGRDPAAIRVPDSVGVFWELLDVVPGGATVDWRWIGGVLRRFHDLPRATVADIASDPVGRIRANVDTYLASGTPEAGFGDAVVAAVDEAEQDAATTPWVTGVVHGDLHPANVVATRRGPVVVDFDLAGVGVVLWDLTVGIVHVRRFGERGSAIEELFDGYGRRVPLETLDPLVRIQELLCVSYALKRVALGAPADAELRTRMGAVRDRRDLSRWRGIPRGEDLPGQERQ